MELAEADLVGDLRQGRLVLEMRVHIGKGTCDTPIIAVVRQFFSLNDFRVHRRTPYAGYGL